LLSVNLTSGVVLRRADSGRPAASEDLSGYQHVKSGDLVMNQLGKPHGALGISPHEGIISPAYFVATIGPSADQRYMHHLLRTRLYISEYERRGKNMPPNQFDISWDQFRDIELLLPPLSEQRAIADYLDTETARIDALIDKKQRMIELIDQRTEAQLLRVILGEGRRGADSPSGYFASVPDSWVETALRHLGCEVQTGPFGSQLHAEDYVEGGWPVVNPMNIGKRSIEAVSTMTVSDDKRKDLNRHVLRIGDIVFGRRGEMGRAGLVEERHAGWLCGTGSLRLRIIGNHLLPEYLKLMLGTAPARAYFELTSVGSTMDNLNSEIVLAFPCLVPPLDEQLRAMQLVADLDAISRELRSCVARQIDLLRERRQALITAAVTGELEIPGLAA